MTNYGAIAILRALAEDAPARQLRVLIALETFRADPDGWRTAGQILLASTANMSIPTLKRARPELVQASLIEYRPGLGRGVLSRYRLMVNGLEKGSHADPFSDGKRVHPSPEKGSPAKRANQPLLQVMPQKTGKEPCRLLFQLKLRLLKPPALALGAASALALGALALPRLNLPAHPRALSAESRSARNC